MSALRGARLLARWSGGATLERARAAGLTRIELTVRENNQRVVALYERFGFVREGIQRNAIRVDGKYESLLAMALIF
jgi:RimJ/RimL family protein N-acetyltransferase